jgi:hypothetical protein
VRISTRIVTTTTVLGALFADIGRESIGSGGCANLNMAIDTGIQQIGPRKRWSAPECRQPRGTSGALCVISFGCVSANRYLRIAGLECETDRSTYLAMRRFLLVGAYSVDDPLETSKSSGFRALA